MTYPVIVYTHCVAMALPAGDHDVHAIAKQLKVLMPPSLHKLRISHELAGCFDDSGGGGGKGVPGTVALVVSPFGKVWRVEVGRDGDGAFLGRGWAEFLAAHGVGVGWFVVLRHKGCGVLTIKAFDTSFCMKEFATPASVMESRSSKRVSCKPQFLRIMQQDFMENMMIPARFVKQYVTEEWRNSQVAVIVSPRGKFWRIELQNNQSGMFFAGVWSQFLAFHGISEGEVLLLRYEGNMVFKFKVFGLNGCQKDLKNDNTVIQQNCVKQEPSLHIRKRKADDERASCEEEKRPKSSMASLNKASSQNGLDYQIGPPSWIKKEVTAYMLERLLSLPVKFCHSVGFRRACTITLKTPIDSTRSWQVRGLAYQKVCYLLGEGWNCFCKENRLKKGDLCTFNVIETMLWHVFITRSSTSTERKRESPCSSSMERKSNNHRSGSDEQSRPQSSMISLSKASSYTRSAYEIGPPSWIKREIKAYSLLKHLFLARGFCDGIGLRGPSTITLKTSIDSTMSWQVCCVKQRNGSYLLGSGWKKFSQENELKVGDVCTFNIVKMVLWHVVIAHA